MNQMVATNGMMQTNQQFPIFQLPGRPPFMLARDVATAYGVTTKRLNEARSNNPKKFVELVDYFQLTSFEVEKCDIGRTSGDGFEVGNFDLKTEGRGGKGHLPFGYSRRGAYMFATILSTDAAIEMALRIVEGFIAFETAGMKIVPPDHVAVAAQKLVDLQGIYIERLELQAAGFGPNRGLPWSEADIRKVFAMKAKGLSHKKIGEHFGRGKNAVEKILKKHAKDYPQETNQADLFEDE